MRYVWFWSTVFCLMRLCVAPVGAQSNPPTEPSPAETASPEAVIVAKRDALTQQRAEITQQRETALAGQNTEAVQDLTTQLELLDKLDRLFEQQLAALQREQTLSEDLSQLQGSVSQQRASGTAEPPPYSVLLLDRLQDERDTQQARQETLQAARRAAEEALQHAQEEYKKHERERRQAREALDTNSDPGATGLLQRQLTTRQLESRVVEELVQLRTQELANEKQELVLQDQRETLLNEKIAWISDRTVFTDQILEEVFAAMTTRQTELQKALQEVERARIAAERRLALVQRRMNTTAEPSPETTEELEAKRLEQEVQQLSRTFLVTRLEWLAVRKEVWQRRYQLWNTETSRQDLKDWNQETGQILEGLERTYRLENIRIAEVRRDLATLQTKLEQAQSTGAPSSRWVQEQERAQNGLLRVHESYLTGLDTTRRLYQRLASEIQAELQAVNLAERLHSVQDAARAVWHYELIAVEDHPLTVRTIVAALTLLILGIVLSRTVSRLLGRRIFPRFGLDEGAATAFQTLTFYFLVVFFTLFALQLVNVPLTLFTFLGGALAIGVGFGSQNILNNFISGLILLAERPIRVGDMVDVDGTYGAVESIGLRSTRVRSFTNIHVIVPNSAFLEKNVVNWTLSDDLVRIHISVGVIYGSPTDEVTRLIGQAVDEHKKILKNPEPVILFTEFGDNSLNFEVHFWIRMRRLMDRRRIESDVRYQIDGLFRQAGIVIAFPQRDVHLDMLKPLEVKVVGDGQAPQRLGNGETQTLEEPTLQAEK